MCRKIFNIICRRVRHATTPRDSTPLTELAEPDRRRALERFRQLRAHLEQDAPLAPIANEAEVSLRTAQRWVRRYRECGLAGLIRTGRADRGTRRRLHDELRQLAEGLALQRPPLRRYHRVRSTAAPKSVPTNEVLPLASYGTAQLVGHDGSPIPGRSSSRSREADWDIQGLAHPYQLRINQPSGRVFVVWKLDRLSRSLKDVLHIMDRIADAGAGFRSVTENIDTTTPAGRMMMQMVGSFAEFERAMIRERTSAGIAAARAEGRVGGRRKKLDAAKRREIAESVITGRKSGADMARLYNVSQPTVSRIVAQHRMAQP